MNKWLYVKESLDPNRVAVLTQKNYNFPGVLPNNIYIKEIIYNEPATIVLWSDKTKTVCKCHPDDTYSKESGLAMCICKKLMGNKEFKETFEYWLPEQESLLGDKVTLKDVMYKAKKNKKSRGTK